MLWERRPKEPTKRGIRGRVRKHLLSQTFSDCPAAVFRPRADRLLRFMLIPLYKSTNFGIPEKSLARLSVDKVCSNTTLLTGVYLARTVVDLSMSNNDGGARMLRRTQSVLALVSMGAVREARMSI